MQDTDLLPIIPAPALRWFLDINSRLEAIARKELERRGIPYLEEYKYKGLINQRELTWSTVNYLLRPVLTRWRVLLMLMTAWNEPGKEIAERATKLLESLLEKAASGELAPRGRPPAKS